MAVNVAVVDLQISAVRHCHVNALTISVEALTAATPNWMFVKMKLQKKTFILVNVIIKAVMRKVAVKMLLSGYVVTNLHVNVFYL